MVFTVLVVGMVRVRLWLDLDIDFGGCHFFLRSTNNERTREAKTRTEMVGQQTDEKQHPNSKSSGTTSTRTRYSEYHVRFHR